MTVFAGNVFQYFVNLLDRLCVQHIHVGVGRHYRSDFIVKVSEILAHFQSPLGLLLSGHLALSDISYSKYPIPCQHIFYKILKNNLKDAEMAPF